MKGDNSMQSKAPPRQTEQQSQGARPRRGLGFWIRRGLVWLVGGLLALAVTGAIYQVRATQIDQRTYLPPGEMVDVNGRLMHINCIPYSRTPTPKAPTCWWVIPTAACTRGCMPPGTLTRRRAWCSSTLRIRSSSPAPHKGGRCTNKPGGWVLSYLG